jgi:hypothetical protein
MPRDAAELAHGLARAAEAVCRRYLSNGRRQGRYWMVGDVRNTPGRSMFVRLKGPDSGCGAAGKWTDAAEIWPAMIAAVTNLEGRITGAHRTWLDPAGFDLIRLGKAPIETPRRAMGGLLGNAVHFGTADDVLAAGEGIETMLSLRCVLPATPMAAALRLVTSPPFRSH